MNDATTTIEPQSAPEPESISDFIAQAYDEAAGKLPSEPVRGDDGKFVSQEAPATEAVEAPAETKDKPEASAEAQAEQPAIEPPASLGAAARERWGDLPREVQESLKEALDQSHSTVEQKAKEVASFEPLKALLEQHKPRFAAQGLDAADAVRRLFAVEAALNEKPVDTLIELARRYGINPSQLAQQTQQQPAVDPNIAAFKAELAQVKSLLQSGAQAKETDVNASVEKFAADPANVHFKEVRSAMAGLATVYPELSLKELYDRACKAEPKVWDKIQADNAKAEAIRKDKAAREASGKSVSAKGSPPPPAAGSAPETIRSIIEATWDGRL